MTLNNCKIKPYHYNLAVIFMTFLGTSVLKVYLIQFFPVFYVSILNVNRQELAFIQFLTYSVLFLNPWLGVFYDKFKYSKRILVSFLGGVIFVSFLLFSMNPENLLLFGVFISITLITSELLRCAMQDIYVKIEKSGENVKKLTDKKLVLGYSSYAIGSSLPVILFSVMFQDINDLTNWKLFFGIGALSLFPLTLIGFFIKGVNGTKEKFIPLPSISESPNGSFSKKTVILSLLVTFIFYYLMWADRIYSYVLNPFILAKHGERGYNLYTIFYLLFINIGVVGSYIALKLSNEENRKKLITLGMFVYAPFMIGMLYVDIFTLIFFYMIINVIGGLISLNNSTILVKVGRQGKRKRLRLRLLGTAKALASITLIPLGTLMLLYYSSEFIIIIGVILGMLSLLLLMFINYKEATDLEQKE